MRPLRAACSVLVVVAAAFVAALPAGAANECDGLMVCVPVAGPWVVVPASTGESRTRVEYQLTCPRGHVVGGLDARLSVRGIDVSFLGRLGSPVNPGITTSRSAVFLGTYVGRSDRAPTFRPFIGCMPASGGGSRVPTSVTAFRPGEPVARRVKTVRVRPGTTTVVQRCSSGERLVGGSHAFAFATRTPPSASLVGSVSGSQQIGNGSVAVRVRGDAELAGVRALVQVHALCARTADEHRSPSARGRAGTVPHAPPRSSAGDRPMSFKSPWLLLGLLVLAAAVAVWLLLDRRRARYAVRYTNLDVLATVVSGRSWPRYVPAALLVLGLASLFVGLARPQVSRTQVEERATVILVVDTSRSMQAEDVEPTRLGAAQEAIRTFLDRAPHDLRVGLVVFAGEAQVATPPTKDHQLVDTAVTDIDQYLVFGGTAIGDALQTAVDLGRQVTDVVPNDDGEIAAPAPASSTSTRTLAQAASCPEEKSPVSILFLSDGAQTRGLLQPLEGSRARA